MRESIMKALYFHEDDYCQVELLPMSALDSSVDETTKIEHFSDDGTAWTAIYLRLDYSEHLKSIAIPINRLAAKLDSILEPVEEVYTGYSTYRERCKNTRAWVLGRTALLANFDESGIIQNLWIVNEPPDAENVDQFRQALKAISEYGDFLIAHWPLDFTVAFRDEDKLLRYLSGQTEDL